MIKNMHESKGRNSKIRLFLILSSSCLLLWASGCALWAKKEAPATPQAAYEEGLQLLEKKKYEKSAEAFRKFKEEFPLSTYTPLAELRLADSLYFDKSYAEAIVQYDEFKKLHPTHPEIPYAIYQVGMCYLKQMASVDRDQTVTEKALEQFRYVVENFSDSKYVPDATTKMQLCQRQLAEQEFEIGYFYYRMDHYPAALGRFEEILKKYPDAGLERRIKPLLETCRKQIAKEEKKRKEKEEKEAKKKSKPS
jgi:outer membrane protein assembly factor BamD